MFSKYLLIVLLIATLSLYSCRNLLDYSHGIIIDENLQPIEGVRVSGFYDPDSTTLTDSKGYFRLNINRSAYLVFKKTGYDSIRVPYVWHQHGETTEYNFVTKDTTRIILRKSKIK